MRHRVTLIDFSAVSVFIVNNSLSDVLHQIQCLSVGNEHLKI